MVTITDLRVGPSSRNKEEICSSTVIVYTIMKYSTAKYLLKMFPYLKLSPLKSCTDKAFCRTFFKPYIFFQPFQSVDDQTLKKKCINNMSSGISSKKREINHAEIKTPLLS